MASPSSPLLAACSNMLSTKAALVLVLLSTTVISTVVGQDCTTITDWQSLRTTIISLKKSQKTLVLCPFDVDHPGIAEEDGIDLYKKGLTLVCHGQTGSVGGDTMYRGSPADIGPIPVGCTIKGKARHFNILADDIALVGLTFSHSQSGAISVGSSVMGTTVSNCHFHNNINIRGDGGAIILGPRSAGTVLIGNEFNNNGAWGGGAVSGVGSELEVRDCLFRGNRANMGVGGAIKLSDEEVAGGGGRRELLSQSTEGRHQKDYERNLNHKSDLSQLSSLSVSSLTLSDSHFMSNTAALAGPAVYMETKSDESNTYIFATTGGNYACANLALESSSMCNGISGGKQCSSFGNTCDDNDSDEKDLGINNDGNDDTPGVLVRDGGVTGMSDDLRDGGTTGMSDDFGPETGPPPEDIAEALGDHTATGDFRDWATWSLPTSDPTRDPTRDPTPDPTPDPTHNPTLAPTFVPTVTPTYNPTAEPTVQCNMDLVTRHSMILTELESISDATALRRTSTPQGKAVDWLVYEDSMYLCPGDNYLVQRYILAVLYYATNGHQGWLTCSRSGDVASNDCPPTTKRFLSNYHECSWAGIGCNVGNFVTRIAFEENGLSGSIPSEIGALFSLKTLRMERGELSGSLPATLGNLANLEKLDLDYNNLWGTLPSTFVHLTNLKLIDLNNNDLSGSIDVLAGLSNLFFIQLQSNYFSGTVSEAFGSLSQLQVFSVQQNQIGGSLALGFCNLRISGYLKYLEADCSSPADGGSVNCVCCTKCYPYDDDSSSLNNADSIGNGGGSIINTAPIPSLTTEAPSPKPTGRPTAEPTHNPTLEPTSEPSPFTNSPTEACNGINTSALRESIINMLAASGVSTRSSLLTNGSPQAKAVWWILNRDPMRLCPGDERIEQRYLAALFYYSTDGPNWLDKGTGDQKFLGSASECYWMGLKCNPYGEITHIDIENNGLGGSLPYEIASFTKLEVLSLEKGEITGRIPTEIGTMQELRELDLDFNMLTGELPYTLGNAPKLSVIDLNSNMLTGSISVLASVKEAYFVQLHNNKFSGDIAPSIGLLGNLQVLTLHKNDIAGVMPFMVCNRLAAYGGAIDHLWADCAGAVPKVSCSCCTKCFEG